MFVQINPDFFLNLESIIEVHFGREEGGELRASIVSRQLDEEDKERLMRWIVLGDEAFRLREALEAASHKGRRR